MTAEADKESDVEEVLLVAVLTVSLRKCGGPDYSASPSHGCWVEDDEKICTPFSALKFRVAYNIQFNNSFVLAEPHPIINST